MEGVEHQHAATMKTYADRKGEGRAAPSSPSAEGHVRYCDAVEEKVEGLAGKVEVLKGVVKEGLKEH